VTKHLYVLALVTWSNLVFYISRDIHEIEQNKLSRFKAIQSNLVKPFPFLSYNFTMISEASSYSFLSTIFHPWIDVCAHIFISICCMYICACIYKYTIQWQDLSRYCGRLIGHAILRRRDACGGAGKVHWIPAGIFCRLWHWNLDLLRHGRLIGVGSIIKSLIMN